MGNEVEDEIANHFSFLVTSACRLELHASKEVSDFIVVYLLHFKGVLRELISLGNLNIIVECEEGLLSRDRKTRLGHKHMRVKCWEGRRWWRQYSSLIVLRLIHLILS